MDNSEVIEKINSFSRWHYQFNLKGHLTPVFDKRLVFMQAHSKSYFFDPLVKFFGGSLKGKRVLDLGCNAGFWSLLCIQNGCDYLVGIDGRKMHIEQAEFVFDVNGVDSNRFKFVEKNIFDLKIEELGEFDIVLCIGLLNHISKPMTLFETISRVNKDMLLIDTTLSQSEGSFFEVAHEDLKDTRNAVDHELILLPTKLAVVETAKQFGYETKILQPPMVPLNEDSEGSINYKRGARRAFVCAKRSDLAQFPAAFESVERLRSRTLFAKLKTMIEKDLGRVTGQ